MRRVEPCLGGGQGYPAVTCGGVPCFTRPVPWLHHVTFGAGLSLVLYGGVVWACDMRHFQIGIWRTLGGNTLVGYVIHGLVGWGFNSLLP
jgi:hypothetical protein